MSFVDTFLFTVSVGGLVYAGSGSVLIALTAASTLYFGLHVLIRLLNEYWRTRLQIQESRRRRHE